MAHGLFLAHRIPYPPNKGDKIRSWHYLAHLLKNHHMSMGYFVDDPDDRMHIAFLKQKAKYHKVVERSPSQMKARSLLGFATWSPLTEAAYASQEMQQWVDDVVNRDRPDFIYVYSSAMYQFVQRYAGQIPIIMDFGDVDSAKWEAYAQSGSFLTKLIYGYEGARLKSEEAKIAANASVTTFATSQELQLFERRLAGQPAILGVLENGVDTQYFKPQSDTENTGASKPHISFIGAMDYRPNVEAVEWFVTACWPQIKLKRPDAEFYIVGRKPTVAVKNLQAVEGVTVTGEVDDVRQWLHQSALVVAPIFTARGIQNKVLEAMAAGKAVISSAAAAQGVRGEIGHDLLVCDDAPSFIRAVLTLLDNDTMRREQGRAARDLVLKEHSWAAAFKPLDQILQNVGV